MSQQPSSLFCPRTAHCRDCWTQPWPCLKTSACLAQPLGLCSLLTLLLSKVNFRILYYYLLTFIQPRVSTASPVCLVQFGIKSARLSQGRNVRVL